MLRLFNIITIKQEAYVRYTSIWFRRYLYIFFTRSGGSSAVALEMASLKCFKGKLYSLFVLER